MAKIVIDCADPNDFAAVIESAENAAGSCTITYAKQHLEMEEVGTSKSQRESARIIAEDSGESEEAVRKKIQRGLKKMGQRVPPEEDCKRLERNKKDRERRAEKKYQAIRTVDNDFASLAASYENFFEGLRSFNLNHGEKIGKRRMMDYLKYIYRWTGNANALVEGWIENLEPQKKPRKENPNEEIVMFKGNKDYYH